MTFKKSALTFTNEIGRLSKEKHGQFTAEAARLEGDSALPPGNVPVRSCYPLRVAPRCRGGHCRGTTGYRSVGERHSPQVAVWTRMGFPDCGGQTPCVSYITDLVWDTIFLKLELPELASFVDRDAQANSPGFLSNNSLNCRQPLGLSASLSPRR